MKMNEKPVLQVKNLYVRYGEGGPECKTHMEKNRCTLCGTVWVANDISLEVFPGEVLGIVGESGSGKSTLMQSLYFDIEPTSGNAYLSGYHEGDLEIKDLTKNFYLHDAKKEIKSCKNVNFTLEEGQFIGIVGLSGAGKSTILKCINRSYLSTCGEILYNSQAFGKLDLTKASEREILYLRKHEIGYVSQFLNVMPRTTAYEPGSPEVGDYIAEQSGAEIIFQDITLPLQG